MKFRIRKDAPKPSHSKPAAKQSDTLADYRDQLGRATTEQEARDVYERCGHPEACTWTDEQHREAVAMRDARIKEIGGKS